MAKDTEPKTVTVEDLHGNELEVPVGLDGVSPVSPNNPHPKAVAKEDREAAVKAREAEVKFAEEMASVSDAGEKAASTNKEDNNPGESQEPTPENEDGAPKDESGKQTGTRGATGKR